MIHRRDIMAAVRSSVAGIPGIKTVGTLLLNHDQVPNQPAAFPVHVGERPVEDPYNLRGMREMAVELWLYTRGTERTDGDLEAAIDDLVDAAEAAFAPEPITNTNTLGDLVTACWIERIQISPGHAEGQAAAVIDLTILTLPPQ